MTEEQGGVIVIPVSQILDGINDKLAKTAALSEQLGRRMDGLEARVERHDKIIGEQMPRLLKFMEDMNVQQQVEAALDSRRVRGISNRDKVIVGGLSSCLMLLGLLQYLPNVLHG